eukprot:1148011-Pelagomonas_calceolata.AAC.2
MGSNTLREKAGPAYGKAGGSFRVSRREQSQVRHQPCEGTATRCGRGPGLHMAGQGAHSKSAEESNYKVRHQPCEGTVTRCGRRLGCERRLDLRKAGKGAHSEQAKESNYYIKVCNQPCEDNSTLPEKAGPAEGRALMEKAVEGMAHKGHAAS